MNDGGGGGGGGGGGEQPFFCFRFNFRPITRLETLATQASQCTDCLPKKWPLWRGGR